jgi:hypothetical protein
MMCLGDRSTFTSTGTLSDRSTFTLTDALSGRHDGSSPLFLEDLLSSRGVCVFARAQALSPTNLFMVSEPGAEQQAQEAKEAVRRQEVISSPLCSLLHPCQSSSGGTGKQHRIEELSSLG